VPPGVYGVTSELSLNFLRPAGVHSGTLTARSELVAAGRSQGLSQATVTDARGQVLSHSTSRYFLQRIDPAPRRRPSRWSTTRRTRHRTPTRGRCRHR